MINAYQIFPKYINLDIIEQLSIFFVLFNFSFFCYINHTIPILFAWASSANRPEGAGQKGRVPLTIHETSG